MPTQRPLRYHNLHAGGPVIDQDENLYQMTSKGLFALNSSGRLDSLGLAWTPVWISLGRWSLVAVVHTIWRDRGDPRSRAVALWNAWKVQQWGDPGRRLSPRFQQGMIWEADEHFSEYHETTMRLKDLRSPSFKMNRVASTWFSIQQLSSERFCSK